MEVVASLWLSRVHYECHIIFMRFHKVPKTVTGSYGIINQLIGNWQTTLITCVQT